MSDIEGQESTTELTESPELTVEPVQDHSTTEQEANPFWGEVEKLTGPNVYKLIQPHLAKADTEARQRVESVNKSYAPWKAFDEQGIQPAHVQQALKVVEQLNTAPEQVFESLRSFLEREGRMPSNAELKQEVIEDEAATEADPRDAEIELLKKQIENISGFVTEKFSAQQQQVMDKEAEEWLSGEITRLSDPKFGYDQADIKEIVRIAAFQSQQSGQEPNIDAAAQQFNALRDRIRTAPRPGQFAPRLPSGPGGGTPQPQSDGPRTKEQRLEAALATLQRGKS